ncbi:unnamed protein product [marine sediment metagenome]|uniref:Uncharacterized protein n=1 Tax=marine sediment metagenome TaxID=412755 RepID=X1RQS4_9ZZZZ
MPGPDQKIGTVLIPEHGLELSPEFIEQSIVSPDFIRAFAHLVGKADDRGILIRATSDGSLHVVTAGVPFEKYLVYPGTCNTDHDFYDSEEFEVAYNVTDFLIEAHPVMISFRNSQGTWLHDKVLPVGYHSIDFIHYGFRIRNRVDTEEPYYEITIYR